MAKTKKNKNNDSKRFDESPHPLMEPDDWSDPPHRKVLGEYHKRSADATGTNQNTSQTSDKNSTHTSAPVLLRVIDLSSVELLAYALSRAAFPKGAKVPIYLKGMVDMDVVIKDTDVFINTNNVSFEPPPLRLWHFFFTYKGKPVIEYGQGVKNMIKIHHSRAIFFLLAMWVAGRKRRKNQKQKTEDERMDITTSPTIIKKIKRKTPADDRS